MTSENGANCSACGAPLPANAVLCVRCGFHLKHGYHLATATGNDADALPKSDPNPYAACAVPSQQDSGAPGEVVFDLTEYGAARAKAITADANSVIWLCLIACLCTPVWLLTLPWFAYRLYSWYDLRSIYAELRSPNSFSPHGQVAADFASAKPKLMAGVILGSFFWILLAIGAMASWLDF